MQMRRLAITMFCLLPLTAALYGCGSSNKSGSGTPDTVATVSEATCLGCHSTWTEELTGRSIVTDHNASLHKTQLVGCQDCHGGGAQHNGVGPMPYPNPDHTQCASCHSDISEAYAASNHGSDAFTIEADADHIKCSRCHTHQGALISNITGFTGDKTVMDSLVGAPGVIEEADARRVQCVTCHTTHKTDELRAVKTRDGSGNIIDWQPSTTVGAATPSTNQQFNMCTSCHTYTNPDGTLVASGTAADGVTLKPATAPYYHNTAWYRTIATTHWDNPATAAIVEGYVLRTNGTNNANPCFDCHGHESKTGTRYGNTATPAPSIHTDWAESAHGGKILTAKYDAATALGNTRSQATVDAVMVAGATDATAPGWVHYDWDSAGRASCQRCHTASGAANFMADPANYNSANNNFTHITAGQNEVLYCWGCHTDAGSGTLRTPGAITETYSPGTAGDPATTVAYPDIAGSNVCMTCHVGRETGEVIKNNVDADGVRSFINSHYLSAGGTLFATTGYEYDGQSYANPSYFAHDKIGSTDAPGTGSNGPCAGCHMTSPNSHKFTNVTKTAGVITALTSTACITCHDGEHGTALTAGNADAATFLATEEHHYHAALDALKAALDAKGIYFYAAHPYFYTAPYVVGGVNTAFTNWAGVYGLALWKDTMGAAFNYNLLHHDPGGYAHNRMYSKRLIFDAIDFIDNGVLDGTINVAGDAATYLDGSSTTAGVQRP